VSNWPSVWVLLATYKRTEAALKTVKSLQTYLKYPNLHYHICDDGSGETDDGTNRWHVGVLTEAFGDDVTWHEMGTPPGQFNTGGNINRGIRAARDNGCNIHMLVFDDWALYKELDLRPMADVLEREASVGYIRLSFRVPGLSGTCTRYDVQRLNAPWMWFRLIRRWSLQNPWKTEGFLVSTQPYIAHLRFFQAYGWHPENVTPGKAEVGLNVQYSGSPHGENGPQILFSIGPCITHAPWMHLVGRAHHYARVSGL
jgi:hypothetical protein